MPNRFATTIPGATPWRERAGSSPFVAEFVKAGFTDEEAADVLAYICQEYRGWLDKCLENDGRFLDLVERLVAVKT